MVQETSFMRLYYLRTCTFSPGGVTGFILPPDVSGTQTEYRSPDFTQWIT